MNRHILVIVTYNRCELLKECLQAAEDQTIPYSHIIVVDNASTDGTAKLLETYSGRVEFTIVRENKNLGGAGGFADALRFALDQEGEWVTIIDDDAILRPDFLEKIEQGIRKWGDSVLMYAGVPLTDGIRPGHRRRIRKGIVTKEYAVPVEEYEKDYFSCQIASFCGLVMAKSLIAKIGLPEERYFIWYDDTEYCLRAGAYSRIINCNKAVIDHKANTASGVYKIGWKEYYGVRNRIDLALRHYGRRTAVYLAMKSTVKGLRDAARTALREGRGRAKTVRKTYADGVRDGMAGRLGLVEPYLPEGMKRKENG